MTIVRLVLALAILAVAAPAARAQSVEADVLFREGKKLLKEGKIAEACDKLEASDRIESSIGTLLNLADCRERNHQLATAWAAFRKAATAAKIAHDTKRESEAHRREKLLDARLSYLTINVPDGNRVDGLAIARNGTTIDPALWNQSVPIDPGEYEIVGQAPNRERWSKRVKIASEGETVAIEVPKLEAPHAKTPDRPVAVTPPRTPPAKPIVATADDHSTEAPVRDDRAQPSMFTTKRKLALGIAAAGVAGIALGVVFGMKGQDAEKQSDMICPTSTCNDAHALQLNSDARSDGLYANVGYVVGGAAVAGAAVLWFVGAPKAARDEVAVTPIVTSDHVGFSFAGRF